MLSRGHILKPHLIKANTVKIQKPGLPPIPFIFVSPPIFEESVKMTTVPKTSKEHNLLSISDGTRGLDNVRFQLKSGRKRKVQTEHKDFKQSFERFLNFNFQNTNDLSIQTCGSRELSNTGGCQQNNAGN